jgi:hypothetical protein
VTVRPVDSPEFRRWFGASKVVDDRGDPLVVWHGSSARAGDFEIFDVGRVVDVGFHFGTKDAAKDLSEVPPRPFYLRIVNPVELEDPGDWFTTMTFQWPVQDQLVKHGLLNRAQYDQITDLVDIATHVKKSTHFRSTPWTEARSRVSALVRRFLLEQGVDGVKYENLTEDQGSTSWIAFDPRQIKHAVLNRGTWNPEDPNILHGVRR